MCLRTSTIFIFTVIIFIKNTESWSFGGDLSYNPYCWLKECCDKKWIKYDVYELRHKIRSHVYGQHLVETAMDAIAAHWSPYYAPKKALTLSFHGWPGGGKNYVSKFIAESLYKEGTKSRFVHHFIGRIHFPLNSERATDLYKTDLYSWLKGNISNCPQQLFIFDEVDKMPPSVLNAIKPMIDYRDVVDGVDYNKAIFIFLSNTGAGLINEHYEELYSKGMAREQLKLSNFEKLIEQGSFNEEGGFHHSDTIRSNLIDHYIPFLPMQRDHILECIKDEFRLRHVQNPSQEHIDAVLETVEWGPDTSKLFSKTGCKRIGSKVAVLVVKHYKVEKVEL